MLRNAVLTPSNNPLREPVPRGSYHGLDLDFIKRGFRVGGRLVPYHQVLSFSAPSPKYVWNSQGQLVEVPAGQPAWAYDPASGNPLGQIIEPAIRTHCSTDIANNSLGIYGAIDEVSDPRFPNGGLYKITNETGNGRTGFITRTNGGAALGAPDARYAIVKPGDFDRIRLTIYAFESSVTVSFYPQTMTMLDESPNSFIDPLAFEDLGGGFYLMAITTPGDSDTYARFGISGFHANGSEPAIGESLLVALPQAVLGTTVSSFIYNDGTQNVLREAEVAVIENVDTARWFNANAFTMYAEIIPNEVQSLSPAVVLGATAQDRIILFFQNGEAQAQVRGNQGITSISPPPTVDVGDRCKFAVSYRPGIAHISFNGVTQTVANTLDQTPTSVVFGSLLNGTFRSNVTLSDFWAERGCLTAAELQELTS